MPNKLTQFWQELKRRRVIHMIIVYATAAFVIIELVNNVFETLRLPDWTPALTLIILAIGFPLAIIFSWIFDVTPEGIEKTKPSKETRKGEKALVPNSWRIATYISIVVIVFLIGFQFIDINNIRRNSSNEVKSIAILPFTNISGNPEQEYFAEGITETLITELARISALKVIILRNPSKASSYYEHSNNIDAILEGSALLMGERVRVVARLIDQTTGEALWANQFDEELRDVFNLHSDIVNRISYEINVFLTKEEEKYLASKRMTDPEVYKLYLKGRYHIGKRTKQGFTNAITCFEDASERDPQNAYIFSGLADAYTLLCEYGFISAREAYPKALEAAIKAIKLNDKIAETHTSLAYVKLMFEWDWIDAEKSFKLAIEINPNYATAHQWYSFFLILQNREEESIKEQKLALELDPLSLIINNGIGNRLMFSRQYNEAVKILSQTIEIDPNFAVTYRTIGYAYLGLGEFDEALNAFKKIRTITGETSGMISHTLGYGYAVAGKTSEAREILDQYNQISENGYVSPYIFACLYLGLGEQEECFRWLSIAFQEKDVSLVKLKSHPIWDPIRSDQRFIEIYNKIWPDDK